MGGGWFEDVVVVMFWGVVVCIRKSASGFSCHDTNGN